MSKQTVSDNQRLLITLFLTFTILGLGIYFLVTDGEQTKDFYTDISNKLDDPKWVDDLGCPKLRMLTQMDDKGWIGQPVMSPPPPKELMDKILLTMKNTGCKTYEQLEAERSEAVPETLHKP